MRELPNTIPAILRWTRRVWTFLVLSQLFYLAVAWRVIELTHPIATSAATGMARVALAILILSLAALSAALYFHIKLIRPATQSLQSNPTDATALGNWRKGLQLTLALAEMVSLLGFALLITGAPLNQAAPIFAAGTIATLFFCPKNPVRIQTH
jgi:hypothetical protein